MKIVLNGKILEVGGSFGESSLRFVTRAEYAAFSETEKMADVLYLVEDDFDLPADLNNASWEAIQYASKMGILSDYYKVGDGKKIKIKGYLGSTLIPETELELVIAGFDHNAGLETPDEHCTHFLLGRTDRKLTYLGGLSMTKTSAGPNTGGWRESVARNVLLDPITGLRNILPSDLRNAMRTVRKYTNNVAGGSGAAASNITYTEDYSSILSLYEIFGVTKNIDPNEAAFQAQYALFSDILSTYADKRFDTIGENTQNFIWTRSPCIGSVTSYGAWVVTQADVTTGNGVVAAAAPIVIYV